MPSAWLCLNELVDHLDFKAGTSILRHYPTAMRLTRVRHFVAGTFNVCLTTIRKALRGGACGMADDGEDEKAKYVKLDDEREQVLSSVLREYDYFTEQRRRRRELLKEIEEADSIDGKKSAAVAIIASNQPTSSIDQKDIAALGDVLMSVGDLDVLNLIIDSPGGDGTVAEKMIELCRAYCKTFRVMIPNRAKSAATIVALGADEIVMGYCSEIGPIDAQIPTVTGGLIRWISAQSFINARKVLEDKFMERMSKKQEHGDIMQQLASLDLPFIDHCEKLMDFSRDVARKNLDEHMFAGETDRKKRKKLIEHVLSRLSATEVFKVHGRMINAHAAKTDLKLKVKILPKDDRLWQALWKYYVRADVSLSGAGGGQPIAKLLESRSESLFMPTT